MLKQAADIALHCGMKTSSRAVKEVTMLGTHVGGGFLVQNVPKPRKEPIEEGITLSPDLVYGIIICCIIILVYVFILVQYCFPFRKLSTTGSYWLPRADQA
jgi:hypothetical protein